MKKNPINRINETLNNTSEILKRLPDFPEIMDKTNQALTMLASGQIPLNSNSKSQKVFLLYGYYNSKQGFLNL